MSFRQVLLKLFSPKLQNTKYITILLNSKRLRMSDLVVPNIICFRAQKQLATLNNIRVLLKSVLIDLCACNFVQFVEPWISLSKLSSISSIKFS